MHGSSILPKGDLYRSETEELARNHGYFKNIINKGKKQELPKVKLVDRLDTVAGFLAAF